MRRGIFEIVRMLSSLRQAYDKRLGRRVNHSLVTALQAVPHFAALDGQTLVRIVGASANLFWSGGSLVFEKGSVSDALYIILSGRVRIFDLDGEEEVEVASLGPGDFFGELSLLLHTTHTKSAEALEDSELMVLPKESFQELLASNPDLAAHFRRKLEERLIVPEAPKLT
jgi:CRP/FNR family cyclic AMP-dependent transcriptional regulator